MADMEVCSLKYQLSSVQIDYSILIVVIWRQLRQAIVIQIGVHSSDGAESVRQDTDHEACGPHRCRPLEHLDNRHFSEQISVASSSSCVRWACTMQLHALRALFGARHCY